MRQLTHLPYPGSKLRLAEWLHYHMPSPVDCDVLVEPFMGGCGYVLSHPQPYGREVLNDVDGAVWAFFTALQDDAIRAELETRLHYTPHHQAAYRDAERMRDDPDSSPIDRAWGLLISIILSVGAKRKCYSRNWISQGPYPMSRLGYKSLDAIAQRLRSVMFLNEECCDALDRAMAAYSTRSSERVLIYADPPYPREIITGNWYPHSSTDEMQHRMLDRLLECAAMPNVKVAVSSYPNSMYDDALKGWRREDYSCRTIAPPTGQNQNITECLYMSYRPIQRTLV